MVTCMELIATLEHRFKPVLAVLSALERKTGVIYDDEKVSSGSLLMQVCASWLLQVLKLSSSLADILTSPHVSGIQSLCCMHVACSKKPVFA